MSLKGRVKFLEDQLNELLQNKSKIIESNKAHTYKLQAQSQMLHGVQLALCISTDDPWKMNRVRFFHPLMHDPETPIDGLPWAWPVSTFGGFDACGSSWVPPAGSTLVLIFDNSVRDSAYYLGTTWARDRGPDGEHLWNYNIEEYYKIHEGHRKGYLVGKNDGSQVFPPWNTENYNGIDLDSIEDFDDDPDAEKRLTYSNIYGFMTPQFAGIKITDGNYKCNHKNKRFELLSSCGNVIVLKDDHIHNAQTWGHTSCGATGPSEDCNDEDGQPIEKLECEGEESNSTIKEGHPSTPDYEDAKYGMNSNTGHNPYFKRENECRSLKGPGTPQNNKLELPQSGIQFLSISGHSFGMDDSVEEPKGIPEWERALEDFDFGCNDKYLGRTFWKSATGHSIVMSDIESDTKIRGEDNYIRMLTANGIKIELNDHTTGAESEASCPPLIAGEKRGITMQTTSNHTLEMIDNENEQCAGEPRKDGGIPQPKAKKAFIKLRSGYGLEIAMNDFQPPDEPGSQEETVNQHIQIFCPQKDNTTRGPHIMRFQEAPDGPGQVYLQVGGDYICKTYDGHITTVGQVEENPADLIEQVSRHNIVQTEEMYFNKANLHAFMSDEVILMMAGSDCQPGGEGEEGCGPCVWPVLCLSPKGITVSDRVFVSASPDAQCANIFQLTPFHSCTPFEGC